MTEYVVSTDIKMAKLLSQLKLNLLHILIHAQYMKYLLYRVSDI